MSMFENGDIFSTWVSDLHDRNVCIVYLCGELDASSSPRFLADMLEVVKQQKNLILDVHLLEYVDSTGIAAFLATKNAVERTGRKMCLVGCHGVLTRILKIIEAYDWFAVFDDLDIALSDIEHCP